MEKSDNTILAFTELMDKNMDGYFIFFTKDDESGLIMNGDVDKVIDGLASGLIDKEAFRFIMTQAMAIATNELICRNGYGLEENSKLN